MPKFRVHIEFTINTEHDIIEDDNGNRPFNEDDVCNMMMNSVKAGTLFQPSTDVIVEANQLN